MQRHTWPATVKTRFNKVLRDWGNFVRYIKGSSGLSLSFEAAVAKEDSPVTSHKYL